MRVASILLACGCLVVAAWFVLGARQAHDINQVTNVVSGLNGQQRLTAAEAAHANSLLDSASKLNPDSTVDVLRARVALLSGNRVLATRILDGVVKREPDNLDAWYGIATSATDGAVVDRALGHIAHLERNPK
jgi:predicted Zn-dependent protease